MTKDTGKTILLLGALAVGGYLLYNWIQKGGAGFLGGGGSTTTTTTTTETVTLPGGYEIAVPNIPIPPGGFIPPLNVREIHAAAGQQQAWIGGTYGAPGQPSMIFKEKTLQAASKPIVGVGTTTPSVIVTTGTKTITIAKPLAVSKGAKVVTVKPLSIAQQRTNIAAAAIKAGAPPRVAAKFKAGKIW